MKILYKRTKTGKIQSYKIWVEDTTIIKETGQLDGKKVLHKEVILDGKNIGKSNETTPLQQAESQALSDWTRKHDEGYKSLDDLEITSEAELEVILPQFNTDANGNKKPMLAKSVNWDKVTYPCLVQPKLDGVRCLMVVDDKADPIVRFLSRNGKEYSTLNHIKFDIFTYLAKHIDPASNGIFKFTLDGEIYSDELTFQEILEAVKKQRPSSLKLKFRAYDVLATNIQEQRIQVVRTIVKKIDSEHINVVDTLLFYKKEEIIQAHDIWVKQGYEGAMIRLLNGIYGEGQRSNSLLKVKEFDTNEFTFNKFEIGQREEDLIAVCFSDKGEFRAKMIGTKEEKETLQKKEHLGEKLTVKHFGYTDDGLPRFPVGITFRNYE